MTAHLACDWKFMNLDENSLGELESIILFGSRKWTGKIFHSAVPALRIDRKSAESGQCSLIIFETRIWLTRTWIKIIFVQLTSLLLPNFFLFGFCEIFHAGHQLLFSSFQSRFSFVAIYDQFKTSFLDGTCFRRRFFNHLKYIPSKSLEAKSVQRQTDQR